MELKDRLILLRKEKRMTQAELAEALNISRQAISRWETGIATPNSENFIELSKIYGVPVDLIIKESAESDRGAPRIERKNADTEAVNRNKKWSKRLIAVIILVGILSACGIGWIIHGFVTKRDAENPVRIEDTEEQEIREFGEIGVFTMEGD